MFGGAGIACRNERAHALLDQVLSVDPARATGAELSGLMVARAELAACTDGAAVAAMAAWDASADWAADGSATAVTHLVNHTGAHRSSAASLRRTGLDVAGMPHVLAAAGRGTLPLSHLALLAKARRPEVAEVFDRDEPVLVAEAVEARIETWRRAGQLAEDERSYQELVAAALVDLITDGSVSSRRGQLRPLLIVAATLHDLFDRADVPAGERPAWSARIVGGGPIGSAALRELIEQANIRLVVTDDDGEPLYVGRAKRLATAAMLVALIARSGGTCEFPGCHARHHRANAHHIRWWRNGGGTDIDNLALLCKHHHRLVHHGWTLIRGPAGLVFRRPDGRIVEPPPFQQAA